jgi:HNH endonuclease
MYDPALGKTDYVHRVVWRRCFGPIPKGKDVDHKCNVTLCERPDHLQLLTKPDNTRRRHQRAETTPRTTQTPKAVQRFAVALFAGVDRTTVDARALSLEDLVALLSRFEVLDDKRRGRCWSPTEYAPGHTTRGNAGVAAVSALVFDLDRVPPDPKRLESVCWIGHTTWSHTTLAPRWRIALPLVEPVPVS